MALAERRILIAAAVLSAYLVGNEIQFACMNVDFGPAFETADRPENARTYLEGSLGVLRPPYLHTYLFWAYRRLAGLDFSEKERMALTPWDYYEPPQTQTIEPYKGPAQIWTEARRLVNPQAEPRARTRWDGQSRRLGANAWDYYLNCADGAWLTAAETLRDRISRFGAQSAEVKEWLKGQDIVFSNCEQGRQIPEAAPAGLDPIIAKDRAYQIAAAHFYSQGFDEAAQRFEAIAQDPDSPWRKWGLYLAARCYIRKGTLVEGSRQTDPASLGKARQRLERVIDDPALAEIQDSAQGLLEFVLLRLEPEAEMARLSDELLSQDGGEWLPVIWTDYDWLLDRGHRPSRASDLTDWILAFRGDGGKSADATVRRWRETGSLPWLVASLAKIDANHAAVEELIRAAAEVPRESPGYLTVSYHRLRLLAGLKRDDEARTGLDEIISDSTIGLSRTVRNKFLEMRLPLSQDLDSFLKAAPRQTLRDRPGALPWLLDADSLVPLNEEVPLRLLGEAARSKLLDQAIRKQIALAAWARAALIEKQEAEQELRPFVLAHWPELRGELEKYAAQPDAEARQFALVFLLLRYPGIRPYVMVTVRREESFQEREQPPQETDMFRENWWCSFTHRPWHAMNYLKRSEFHPDDAMSAALSRSRSQSLRFLSDQDRAEAQEELSKLFAIPTGPNYLSDQVIRWARNHADDPRVPEALHLAVRSTRFGCDDSETTKFSRAAFQLLHQHYPDSAWAKKTKYWY
jgi:hypothetical protein